MRRYLNNGYSDELPIDTYYAEDLLSDDDEYDLDYDEWDLEEQLIDELEEELLDEDEYYEREVLEVEGLRLILNDEYQKASNEDLREALDDLLDEIPYEDGFNFRKALGTLGSVAKKAGKAGLKVAKSKEFKSFVKTAAPIALQTIGTVYGGPVGGQIGGQLGGMLAQSLEGPKKSKVQTTKPNTVQATPKSGSPAAMQLLNLFKNPQVLGSISSLALGNHGKANVALTNQPAMNTASIANLLAKVAGQVAKDAEEIHGSNYVDLKLPVPQSQGIDTDSSPNPWSDYFPFSVGEKLLVEYETPFFDKDIGKASVDNRTASQLKLVILIDEQSAFNIPKTKAVIQIDYAREGHGNRAMVSVNGQSFDDPNVHIRSKRNTREITMSIRILGHKVDKITILRSGSDKARIKFQAQGADHTLILSN